jgi:hypothetical protein
MRTTIMTNVRISPKRSLWRLAVAALLMALVAPAQARERGPISTEYGELHYVDVESRRLVIDDQTKFYGPEIRIKGRRGNTVASVADLAPGTPLEYVQHWRDRVWFVVSIRVLDELPAINDEEEGEHR